jgi:hypothetical protein
VLVRRSPRLPQKPRTVSAAPRTAKPSVELISYEGKTFSTDPIYGMNRVGDTLICTGSNQEIIRAFVSNSVEFVVIGGLAVAWYCADRQADDMDLLVNATPENSVRIAKALSTLSCLNTSCFACDSFVRPGLQVPLKTYYYAELLTATIDGPSYAEVAGQAVAAKLFGIPVRLASVGSLLQMKEKAAASADVQRGKHLKDIERLRSHAI